MLPIIPVIDVLNGIVVRAVGGRRHEYRPLQSKLTGSTAPVEVAQALITAARAQELYLADLDAIAGQAPAVDVYRSVRRLGVRVLVDAGVRDAATAERIAALDCDVVAGLETVPTPQVLSALGAAIGSEQLVFSLDLHGGRLLRPWRDNPDYPIGQLVDEVAGCGIKRMIVLDLRHVGSGQGTGSEKLCREIAVRHPHLRLIAGGGIACTDDLRRLWACGVTSALVASALHDGVIGRWQIPGG